MHGRGGEERKRTRHMWTSPTRCQPIVSAAPDVSSSSSPTTNSFDKDGRKISIGDCALFKPPQKSPPFIGIIRSLIVGKEGKLKILVNWLYRSTEVNLGKGLLLETAPNEVFYSFHKDEIPAASLLHPCKVAFLPKGVELPSGTSSFVCRRVYDIANKCLWWLTDQDFINVLQEEVDQLLCRTRIEMHATVQPGGRSPKPMNSPTSSQLKSGSDSVQNSASSFPSQVKGRKRERVDQGPESAKRERTTKVEDGDSGHSRQESILKTELAKITEKGGLVNAEGVEKLVQLMHPDRNVKKIDLASRSMLAAVIAATDKLDCLSQFVQLKGLPVYDEWLQEVHKGKIGDGSGSKDGDKSVEEFLLVLLRALDKLPVNLQALQTCNIGKSVNHLRTHKNSEIQRKARGLVDTWKKRVEAEMNINDAKAGPGQTVPWPTRTRLSEVGQGGNKNSGGSSDVAVKSSVTQVSASRTSSVKITQGENAARSASPGSMKSVPSPTSATINSKDGQPRAATLSGVSDLPISNARDEKSSSSSQSHNNSQSCSSDHAKTGGFSGKEDARSSTAMSVNKVSGSSSRQRKSINGISGATPSGGQRESGRNSSLHKNSSSEKLSHTGLTEKAHEGTSLEGSTPKLIVKIPNRGRSPAESASGGSFDDPSIMNSRASSPVFSEKNDQYDHSSKEKIDFYRANTGADINTESWQSNDFKDVLTASDEGNGSPAAVTDEERCRTVGDSKKMLEASKATSSSSGNENKAVNTHDASFSSINALIDSCVKYSETNATLSAVDDVGMKLLASVAAGEISKSELTTPAGSPEINTNAVEQSCPVNAMECEGKLAQNECHASNGIDEHTKQAMVVSSNSRANDDNDLGILTSEVKVSEEQNRHLTSCSMGLKRVTEACPESKEKSSEIPVAASLSVLSEATVQEARGSECSKQIKENKTVGNGNAGGDLDVKANEVGREVEMGKIDKLTPHPSVEIDVKGESCTIEELRSGGQTAQKTPVVVMQDSVKGTDENVLHPSDGSVGKAVEDHSNRECRKSVDVAPRGHASQSEIQRNEFESEAVTTPENRSTTGLGSGSGDTGLASEHVEENSEIKEAHDQNAGQNLQRALMSLPSQEMEQRPGSKESKSTAMETEEAEECNSATADASSMSAAGVSDVADAKVGFDLNEGFSADDGKSGEFTSIPVPGCAPAVRVISPVPFPASTMSGGIAASITVAAAAKGPFVPPEDLLKSRREPGWRGSAATSAFRPAEPRKVVEIPVGTQSVAPISDAPAGKQSRQLLDIDLNVPDERMFDDITSQASSCQPADGVSSVRCSGGLGLDLNQVDEASDVGNCSTTNGHKIDVQYLQVKQSSNKNPNRETGGLRDFDLNDGPAVDEVITEPTLFTHQSRSSVPSQPPSSGPRTSNTDLGSFSSWFPSTGNTYSAVTISSIMPDRGDQPFSIVTPNGPQRILGPATGGSPFGPDVYRGPVLSSSAMPYPSAPYQYPVFPFNSSFPLPSSFSGGSTYVDSASGGRLFFPTVNSQLIGPASTVSSHYTARPYVFSLPDGSGTADGKKWRGQGLDLNAGPGGPEVEGRDESSTLLPRQLPVASSQALAEEQVRMFQMAGGVLKRKEPDGGWDSYKQSSWQ